VRLLSLRKAALLPRASGPLCPCLTPGMQDYCGVLTEEAIRKNFILVYELLDEMMVSRRVQNDKS
jgi:hypothetical protein